MRCDAISSAYIFASIIRSHRKNKIIKMRIRCTIQLRTTNTLSHTPTNTYTGYANTHGDTPASILRMLPMLSHHQFLQTHNMCSAHAHCEPLDSTRLDSTVYCVFYVGMLYTYYPVRCAVAVRYALCAMLARALSAISCIVLAFASIKCYHIAPHKIQHLYFALRSRVESSLFVLFARRIYYTKHSYEF